MLARESRLEAIGALLLSGCLVGCDDAGGVQDGALEIVSSNGHWLIVATDNARIGCFDSVRVTTPNGPVQWEVRSYPIHQGRGADHAKAKFCTDDFPLRYGSTPSWMQEAVVAKPLEPGEVYLVDAGPLRGTFPHP